MPGKLCNGCKTDITNFYMFKQKSQRTDRLLRAMMPPPAKPIKAEPVPKPSEMQPTSSQASHNGTAPSILLPSSPTLQQLHVQSIGCEFCDMSFPSECELSKHCMEKHAPVDDEPPSKGRFAGDLGLELPETTDLLSILTTEQQSADSDEADGDVNEDYLALSSHAAEHDDRESTSTIEITFPLIKAYTCDSDELSAGGDAELTVNTGTYAENDDDVEELEEEHLDIADSEDSDDVSRIEVQAAEPKPQCVVCHLWVGSSDQLDKHLQHEHGMNRCALCSQTMRARSLCQHQKTCTGSAQEPNAALPSTTTNDPEDELAETAENLLGLNEEGIAKEEDAESLDDDHDYDSDTNYEASARKRRKMVSSTTPQGEKSRKSTFGETCLMCHKVFTNRQRFDLHKRMHQHMDVINAHVIFHPCHLCQLIYLKAADLRRHHRQKHGMLIDIPDDPDDVDNDEADDGEMSTASDVLKRATATAGGNPDDYTDYQFLDYDGYESGEYTCGLCGSAFHNSQETKYHMVMHHMKRFVCPMAPCVYQYESFVRFAVHMANKHINAATHRCGHCGAEHRSFDKLQAHMKTDCVERKFLCPGHCGEIRCLMRGLSGLGIALIMYSLHRTDKKFFSRKAMNNHISWSRGKHFNCKYCDKKFAQPGELSIHTRIHTQERPFVCTVCGKAYKTSSMRASHMDTHIEGKTFTVSGN